MYKREPHAVKQFCQAIDEAILSENVIDFEHVIDLAIEAILHCKSLIIREKGMALKCIQ